MFAHVWVCVFYNLRGVSLCHQIRDSDQHAFEAGRTGVKLIVPLHLRPALFFWGNNLSAGIQGRVWKEEGIATIRRSWEILWSSSDFLLRIWADALFSPAQVTDSECFTGGGVQHQSKCFCFRSLTLSFSQWWHGGMCYLFFHLFFSPHLLSPAQPTFLSYVVGNYEHGCGVSAALMYEMMTPPDTRVLGECMLRHSLGTRMPVALMHKYKHWHTHTEGRKWLLSIFVLGFD